MPAKKHELSDAERAKRIRETVRELETSNDPELLDRALRKIAGRPKGDAKSERKSR
jgi:hypothetical protein